MFWNPAVMTQFDGMQYRIGVCRDYAACTHSLLGQHFGDGASAALRIGVGNSGDDALVPSSYTSLQLSDRLWIGMSVNAPFGLSVGFPTAWAGAGYAQNPTLKTYNCRSERRIQGQRVAQRRASACKLST